MTTQCPCPHPPGGAVTCEGHQFAYCHVVRGQVQSGCIPILPSQTARPTPHTVLPVFRVALISAGFESFSDLYVSADNGTLNQRPIRLGEDYALGEDFAARTLYEAMDEGSVLIVMQRDHPFIVRRSHRVILLIRFPSIWSRHGREPQDVSTTAR